ncbi:MAG: GTP-binding protein [Candidatus Heimdallarchaeota archaeon]|nr:GTP-binding protein [Candidatus Heimdallarchaeota archaeon]
MERSMLRKIVILGTTGSGKTTFMKNLVGDFDGAEVERRIVIEEAQIINTFTPISNTQFENSTTTVSMNVKSVLFLTTRTNQFHFFPMDNQLELAQEDLDSVYPTVLFDTAGQERFSFMQEIGLNGADGVFIFADGTNIGSVERVSQFIEMIREEEIKKNKTIPIIVFVNKKDLESRGIYVGAASLTRWITDEDVKIYETTNVDLETFMIPIRLFLNELEGFPIDASQIVFNKVHEVY